MKRKQSSAFITTRKGFCYLTVKVGRSNFNIMRIRNYTLDAQDKRDLRRLHPDYLFDWKKINQQLSEKRGYAELTAPSAKLPVVRSEPQPRSSRCPMTQGRARYTHPMQAIH